MSFIEATSPVSSKTVRFSSENSRESARRLLSARLSLSIAIVDVLAIASGFILAVIFAEVARGLLGVAGVDALEFLATRMPQLLLLGALTIGVFAFGGLYRRSSWELGEIKMIVAGVCLVALFDTALQFVLNEHNSRIWSLAAYPLVALMVVLFRMFLRSVPMVADAMTSHVIQIGSGVKPERLIFEMRESRAGPVRLLRSLSTSDLKGLNAKDLDQKLIDIAYAEGVPAHRAQAVFAPSSTEIKEVDRLSALLTEVERPFSIVMPFAGLARNGLGFQKVIGADMVMAESRPGSGVSLIRAVKRAFDIVGTVVAVVLLLPLLSFIVARLSMEDGPIFFAQTRVGRNGRRFKCLKFRTMRPDAQERLEELLATDPAARLEWDKYQKLQDDPRITPIGQFLRKTSLDELPQLFNVLAGDMSLVGPRPIIAPEIEGYPGDLAYYDHPDFNYYTRCTPGITGLWQVSGRSETSHDERVRLDRWYARNMSFWLDIIIIFKTVRTVLFRKGSV